MAEEARPVRRRRCRVTMGIIPSRTLGSAGTPYAPIPDMSPTRISLGGRGMTGVQETPPQQKKREDLAPHGTD